MISFRKKIKPKAEFEGALTLRTADGIPLYTFPHDVVTNMRHMETTLLYKDALPACISIVAALREEGVTYTTLALATTLAFDLAVRVCVVELNWWSPGISIRPEQRDIDATTVLRKSRRTNRKQSESKADGTTPTSTTVALSDLDRTGLAAVLMETASLDEALVQTDLPNLAILPAGHLSIGQRPAMARSDALKACIAQLSRRFDHVLLDVPAILTTSDAIALASLGNACCVVVRQGVTPMTNTRRALDDVKHLPMLGVVMNKAQIALPRWVRALIPQD